LHRGGAGPDDTDDLVVQPVEVPGAASAGVGVVPPAGVERVAGERLHAQDARKLRPVQRSVGHDDEAGAHPVLAVGGDDPAPIALVPPEVGDLGLQAGPLVELEAPRDRAAVLENLGRARVLLRRHVAELLEQRQIDVRLDITGRARVAVPVPGPAHVATLLDQPDIVDPGLAQPRPHQETAEATTHHDASTVVREGRPLDGLTVRIIEVVDERVRHLDVLVVAVGTEALVALDTVLLAEGPGVVGRHAGGGTLRGNRRPSRPSASRRGPSAISSPRPPIAVGTRPSLRHAADQRHPEADAVLVTPEPRRAAGWRAGKFVMNAYRPLAAAPDSPTIGGRKRAPRRLARTVDTIIPGRPPLSATADWCVLTSAQEPRCLRLPSPPSGRGCQAAAR